MALEHKGFALDFKAFERKLGSVLHEALSTNDQAALLAFVGQNLRSLRDPNQGGLLKGDWRESLETVDVHQLGDIALTLFYDPLRDIGLGYEWQDVEDILDKEIGPEAAVLLGNQFGPKNKRFDPGKMGSFFQSPKLVLDNLKMLRSLVQRRPDLSTLLDGPALMLRQALMDGSGLYVTF
jgi:hypothetical protein